MRLRRLVPFVFVFGVFALNPAVARSEDQTASIKFLISTQQQTITAPFPVRLTLFLHNSGHETLWLYRYAGDPDAMKRIEGEQAPSDQDTGEHAIGGSRLTVNLIPSEAAGTGAATPARAVALERVEMPHPQLVRLDPGGDYEEKVEIAIMPASGAGEPRPGHYRLSAVYGASYSNGDAIARALGVDIWQGEVESNSIEIDLEGPTGQGAVRGTTVSSDFRPTSEVLVSLSDGDQQVIEQQVTGPDGRFSFDRLPLGTYWLTARRDSMTVDTSVIRHVDLTAAEPAQSVQLPLIPPEVYEPKQILHKPVLFRILDSIGQPAAGVEVGVTWSTGTVLDNVKGRTADDGTLALELIPGRNYVGLRRRGCKKSEDLRADVATGDGIDGFKFALECK